MADINIYGTINTMAGNGIAIRASQVWDESKGKFQNQINAENSQTIYLSPSTTQVFTPVERQTARDNIGALGEVSTEDFNNIFK